MDVRQLSWAVSCTILSKMVGGALIASAPGTIDELISAQGEALLVSTREGESSS
jgi:hypothetical protein